MPQHATHRHTKYDYDYEQNKWNLTQFFFGFIFSIRSDDILRLDTERKWNLFDARKPKPTTMVNSTQPAILLDARYNVLTVLNPLYITRISCRVNFVWRHRSSKATVTGFGTRVVSNSYTTSSIGLSGGVAILLLARSMNSCTQLTEMKVPKFRWLLLFFIWRICHNAPSSPLRSIYFHYY